MSIGTIIHVSRQEDEEPFGFVRVSRRRETQRAEAMGSGMARDA